jgi:hypothetical protein
MALAVAEPGPQSGASDRERQPDLFYGVPFHPRNQKIVGLPALNKRGRFQARRKP